MEKSLKNICIIGLGYIGLPTASVLATKGNFQVLGVDVSKNIVDTINAGNVHIVEPDLDILVKSAVKSNHLKASLKPEKSDAFIIAVPTPFKNDKQPDISYVETAAYSIAPVLEPGNLVILESTSPVGTTERIAEIIYQERKDLKDKVYFAHCPERVLPGRILHELEENDRIIGGIDKISAKKAKELYQTFVKGLIFLTTARTAEMCKLTENAFRDVNIAFANELSLICDKLNIDVWELIELANHHPRVNILQPGPGVGGHCIAVDPWFIVDSAPEEARLIRTARQVNDYKPSFIVNQIKEKAKSINNPVIACLGLAFKANIDDLRESPAIDVVRSLRKENVGKILVVEPFIKELPLNLTDRFNEINQAEAAVTSEINMVVQLVDIKAALKEANIVVLLVNHSVFAGIDQELLKDKIIIDTRGLWR